MYDITYNFTQRFLKRGDRTIDQMIQAACSGKQNIVEGSADGMTSSEMELNLINVARASIKELREDMKIILGYDNCPFGIKHISDMRDYCHIADLMIT